MKNITGKYVTGLLILSFAAMQILPDIAQAQAPKIVLDAGHGGSDPGAVGVNGLYEMTVNLDVVKRLQDLLTKQGYEVLLTRDKNEYLSLAQRVAITDELKPDLFVSVHANSHTNAGIRGSLVLYYDKDYPQADYPPSDAMAALTPESKKLAQLVQDNMVKAAGTVDRGIVPSAVYVARMGSVPSVLVETAFLSNGEDAALLADGGFRQKFAVGIGNGISAYLAGKGLTPGAFADVMINYWANEAIQKLKDKGIVQGEYGYYYPERSLTRAEFVAMLERQFPLPDLTGSIGSKTGLEAACEASGQAGSTVTEATYTNGCSTGANEAKISAPKDLVSTHWAYESLTNALNKGILTGYADNTVRPDKSLTRGEAAVLIDRVIWPGSSQTATKTVFSDVPKSLWSAAAINRLKDKGIINGDTASTYAPERPISRAEMAALLARLIK